MRRVPDPGEKINMTKKEYQDTIQQAWRAADREEKEREAKGFGRARSAWLRRRGQDPVDHPGAAGTPAQQQQHRRAKSLRQQRSRGGSSRSGSSSSNRKGAEKKKGAAEKKRR